MCDGQAVLDAAAAMLPAAVGDLGDLREVVDTYGDLLVADAVHDVVSGRIAVAQELMDAAAGLSAPPELRILQTQRQGFRSVPRCSSRFPSDHPTRPRRSRSPTRPSPRSSNRSPAHPDDWTWTRNGSAVTLTDLGLGVPMSSCTRRRVWMLSPPNCSAARPPVGPRVTGAPRWTGSGRCWMCSAGCPMSCPVALAAVQAGVADLRARLGDLRAAAAAVLAGLSADPPITGPARAWGLTEEDAADVLVARIDCGRRSLEETRPPMRRPSAAGSMPSSIHRPACRWSVSVRCPR